MSKNIDYEKSVTRLREIIAELENPNITLETSMKLFEEGVILVKECGEVLDAAQQKIEVLSESLNKIQDEVE
ncbi:MAG: exodeoxyribonuclease VII small subunit [Oscillospiraceae bacterium]|nr:exodeoxyribonuclease VII small subunit [Oscillospiraceae bacterium]